MDRSLFTELAPGEVVDISSTDCAFVPDPLPPREWTIAESTWRLFGRAMHEVGRLDGIAINLREPGILLRPLENREAIRSSSLEGTFATPRELLLFEMPDGHTPADADTERINAWREVHNYKQALQRSASASVIEAPLGIIRQLHSVLLTGVRGSDRTPGAFRTSQVYIGGDRRFVPPPAMLVPQCLEELEVFMKASATDEAIPPLIRAFVVHYQFETIHPFLDGNGRVGRLLMALMIRELCNHRRPWLYLSAYFDRFKNEYIDRLFGVSARGEWTEWVDFCLRATITQAMDTFERCNNLLTLREEYRHLVGGKARLSTIVDQLFISPLLRTASLPGLLNVSYPTAKSDIEHLTALNIVRELPDVYPKTHYAPAIFNIAFQEPGEGAPSIEK